jgi:hypothetical protein
MCVERKHDPSNSASKHAETLASLQSDSQFPTISSRFWALGSGNQALAYTQTRRDVCARGMPPALRGIKSGRH